jgi:hypothetical protein
MKKPIIYLITMVLMLSLTLPFISPAHSQLNLATDANPNIVVTNYSWYIDKNGILNVVGQAQNQGLNTVEPVNLAGVVHSSTGIELANSITQVLVHYMLPQQKAPFIMQFYPPGDQEAWGPNDPASIEFTGYGNQTTWHQYADLSVTNKHNSIGTTEGYEGAYMVDGTIKNTGSQTAANITIVCAFFNKASTVVGVGYTNYYITKSLAPQGTVDFEIAALDLNQSMVPDEQKINSYTLLVQAGGPLLPGTPLVTADPNSTNSTSDTTTNKTSPFNLTSIAIIVAIVVVAIVVVIAAMKFVKPKPKTTTKEKVKQRKTTEA